jgi:outer membrane protein assembly factor BamB
MLFPTFPYTIITLAASAVLATGVATTAQNVTEVSGVNLDQLRETGYRIDWINQPTSKGLHLPTITKDSFYTVDNSDFVSKYDIDSGKWLWSTPVGNQTYKIKSITEIKNLKRTYVLSEGGIYVIETITGDYPSNADTENQDNSQFFPLQEVANTSATLFNGQMIYGSTTGNAVWFNPSIGFTASTYNIGSTIDVPPTFVAGIRTDRGMMRYAIVTASNDGTVIAIDAKDVQQLWTVSLLDSVAAPVSYGSNNRTIQNEDIPRSSVFIAGTDRYLRSVDLHTGRPRWRVLTKSPLQDSPFVLQTVVYQRIPNVGLAAFQAFPDDFSGKQNWIAENISGTVITTTKAGKLVCWDEQEKIIQIVDPRKGGIVATLPLPSIRSLTTDQQINGSLFLITEDDTILRLDPRR